MTKIVDNKLDNKHNDDHVVPADEHTDKSKKDKSAPVLQAGERETKKTGPIRSFVASASKTLTDQFSGGTGAGSRRFDQLNIEDVMNPMSLNSEVISNVASGGLSLARTFTNTHRSRHLANGIRDQSHELKKAAIEAGTGKTAKAIAKGTVALAAGGYAVSHFLCMLDEARCAGCVVTDVDMVGMSGLELAAEMPKRGIRCPSS